MIYDEAKIKAVRVSNPTREEVCLGAPSALERPASQEPCYILGMQVLQVGLIEEAQLDHGEA